MLLRGVNWGLSRSMSTMSALYPGSIFPKLSRPKAFAPFTVAIFTTSPALHTVGSSVTPFCSSAAKLISVYIFRLLFDAWLSVPMATFTPFASIFATGAMPLASFRLLLGLWRTLTPFCAMMSMSSSVTWTQWAAAVGMSKKPMSARCFTGVQPCCAMQSATSLRDSDRCMWKPCPVSCAFSIRNRRRSSPQVYMAWGAMTKVMRGSPENCSYSLTCSL